MAVRGILPNFKFLMKRSQLIGQFRLSHIMQVTQYFIDDTSNDTIKLTCGIKSYSGSLLNLHNLNCSIIQRWKHNKKQKSQSNDHDSDDDEEEDNEENIDPYALTSSTHSKHSKIMNVTTSSIRIDAVIKAGLNMARNKVEVALYEGKIRINEKKLLKKGLLIHINDVIDLVHGPSPKNENFLLVSRITILDAYLKDDNYKLKILKEKSLIIENYEDSWKSINNDS